MKFVHIVLVIAVTSVILSGCNKTTPAPSPQSHEVELLADETLYHHTSLNQLLTLAAANHQAYYTQQSETSFSDLLYADFVESEDIETAAFFDRYIMKGERSSYIAQEVHLSYEQVTEDIHFLMDYLKYGYAGYEFFGGDAQFDAIKQSIAYEAAQINEPVSAVDLRYLLQQALYPVIGDRHFEIDGWVAPRSDPGMVWYWVETVEVATDGIGYFAMDEPENGYITHVDFSGNEDATLVQDAIKPSLTEDGRIVFRIAGPFLKHSNPHADILFENGQTQTITLTPVNAYPDESHASPDPLWTLSDLSGVPVLRCNSFMPMTQDQFESFGDFVDTATTLKESPYLIIDIRNNTGGMAQYAADWLKYFTGSDRFYQVMQTATLVSDTVEKTYPEQYGPWFYDMYDKQKANGTIPSWQMDKVAKLSSPISNDTTIFLLMDYSSRSAAEYFAAWLLPVDNVVFVGDNTFGQFNFGSNRSIYLPNSGITVACGFNIALLPNYALIDSVGFEPDILCNSANAPLSVVNLILNQD